MDHTKLELALEARREFDEAVERFGAAGVGLKQAPTGDLVSALTNAHEDVLSAEIRAVSLHRETYGRPTREGVLSMACENARITPPRSPFADDRDPWQEDTTRLLPATIRQDGQALICAARCFAERDRLFSAELVLCRLRALFDAAGQ